MGGSRSKALLALSVIWLVLVCGYMAWGAFEHRGLYRWLAELQIVRFGGYYPRWTGILPALLLALPAIGYLRRYGEAAQAVLPQGPVAEARRGGRVARNMAIAGLLFGLIGIGVHLMARGIPDGTEAATPIDIATLGDGPVPSTRVSVRGAIDDDAATGVSETGRFTDENIFYVGFRPESGGAKSEPLRLFVARRAGNSRDAATRQVFMPDQIGYLVENGLPALALDDLRSRGIAVASPHYVLQTREGMRREPYYVVAVLGGLMFAICLLVALIGGVQARARMRSAVDG